MLLICATTRQSERTVVAHLVSSALNRARTYLPWDWDVTRPWSKPAALDYRPNSRVLEKSQLISAPTAMPRSSRPKCSSITGRLAFGKALLDQERGSLAHRPRHFRAKCVSSTVRPFAHHVLLEPGGAHFSRPNMWFRSTWVSRLP